MQLATRRSLAGSARRIAAAIGFGAALMLGALPGGPITPTTSAAPCQELGGLTVRGAERQRTCRLADLRTPGLLAASDATTYYTVQGDWNGLHAAGSENPPGFTNKVPGVQIDGYFADRSAVQFNTHHNWNHDAQFVIRLPDDWNGKIVISGAPGVRRQYANDFIIGDLVLAKGYAFASTDKGNSGAEFYKDGRRPGDAIAEWHDRVRELTGATQEVARDRYNRAAEQTFVTGVSNGGYLARYAIENDGNLYDGAVDWEGTLFRAEGPNLFTYLPTALKYYPTYAAAPTSPAGQAARDAMIAAGFEPGSEFLWPFHYQVYWDLTQRIYREELDPDYDGALEAGIPYCQSGTPNCDADYDYASRPREVKRAVERISLTGRIRKPMITLHGTLDTLLPIKTDSDVYAELIREAGRGDLHRYYVIEWGTHVDSLFNFFPNQLRPILPCYREAFEQLERGVGAAADDDRDDERGGGDGGARRRFVPKENVTLNTCSLRGR